MATALMWSLILFQERYVITPFTPFTPSKRFLANFYTRPYGSRGH